MEQYLADTTVIVEHWRGNVFVWTFLKERQPAISSVTRAELIQGCQNKKDLTKVVSVLKGIDERPISDHICRSAIELLRAYYLSNGLQFLDALIAATALKENLTLVTGNIKHFQFIPSLVVKNWKEI